MTKSDEGGKGGVNFFPKSRDVIDGRPLTLTLTLILALILTLILTLLLTLAIILTTTLSLILTLTRTAACGNYFPVRQIFYYTGLPRSYGKSVPAPAISSCQAA